MLHELKIIGQRLKYIRKQACLSRREVYKLYKISDNTIKSWKLGEAEVGVLRLAKYLAIYQDFGIYVNIDAVLNTKSEFFLPITATHNLNILKCILEI
jgi:transcriptional regulator with XRE-family HTH domain